MDTQQLLDALTAHIALYHSSSSSPQSSNPNATPRSSVLRWFAALSIPHRRAALTAVDADFTRFLLKMLSVLRTNGHGFFFLLPDLPSESLPTLLFRRSRGLLTRAAAKDRRLLLISSSILLFGSSESHKVDDGCVLDSITVAEDLVCDVDRFVEVMDGLSGGKFLRGEETGLGSAWFELPWLKDKGYYSVEEFVANKLETMLRIAWMNAQGGRRQKGVKGKDVAGAAGLAANAFWRKKGCADWWDGLDPGERKKIVMTFFGMTARSLVLLSPTFGLAILLCSHTVAVLCLRNMYILCEK